MTYREAISKYMPEDTIEGADLAKLVGPHLEAMMADRTLDPKRLPLACGIVGAICRDARLEINWSQM